MNKILVVYFSRTGTAKKVAEQLAQKLGADIEPIVEKRSRRGFLGFLRSGFEATTEKSAHIQPSIRNPADYDLVVVGGPTWNGSLSSPVRAYLRRHFGFAKQLAFFATCGGKGEERVFEQMADEACRRPMKTMICPQATVESGAALPTIEAFARELRAGSETAVRSADAQALRLDAIGAAQTSHA